MAMPDEVLIGAILYPVEVVGNLRDGQVDVNGVISYRPYRIRLDSELDEQGRKRVLWHEILHGILTHAGHDDDNERHLEALAYGIMQVLRDNEELRQCGS